MVFTGFLIGIAGLGVLEQDVSQEIHPFSLQDVNPSSSTYKEKLGPQDYDHSLLLLNFAAPWCPYCVEEFPLFQDVYEPGKVDILVVDIDDEHPWEGFQKLDDYTYPFLGNSKYRKFGDQTGGDVGKIYGIDSIPVTYVIKDGEIKKIREEPFTKRELEKVVENYGR